MRTGGLPAGGSRPGTPTSHLKSSDHMEQIYAAEGVYQVFQRIRRLLFALMALALAYSLRAPAVLAVSPELSMEYWLSRLAREDRAGSQITRTSEAAPQLLAQLGLELTPRLTVAGELATTPDQVAQTVDGLADGAATWPVPGYRVEATYRLPLLGAAVGPTYVYSVLPEGEDSPVTVTGLGGLVAGGVNLSKRVRLEGSVRHVPQAEVLEAGRTRQGTYTQFQVGASLNLWRGLEAHAGYRQEQTEIPNPAEGLQERGYQQSGYTLGLAYQF